MVIGIVPRMTKAIMASNLPNGVKRFATHEAGPLTVFFWAPMAKWGLAFANLNELRKPVDMISTKQQFVMLLTGFVWVRWAMVISPVNYMLAAVNLFVACTGAYQLHRKWQAGLLFD